MLSSFQVIRAHRATLISVFFSLSQTPIYTGRPWIWGWCIGWCVCSSFYRYSPRA